MKDQNGRPHSEPFEDPSDVFTEGFYHHCTPEVFSPSPSRIEVATLLQCPIAWEQIAPGHLIVHSLEDYWQEVAKSCLIRGSGDLAVLETAKDDADYKSKLDEIIGEGFDEYFVPEFLEIETEERLSSLLPAIRAWISRAREIYIEQVRRFRDMTFVSAETYGKHFRRKRLSAAEIRKATTKAKKHSLFYPRNYTRKIARPNVVSFQ